MNRYIIKLESFYDQYVRLYNDEKSKLKAFSELSNIHYGLKSINSLKKYRIEEKAETLIELFLVAWVNATNDKELTFNECILVADEIDSEDLKEILMKYFDDVYAIYSIEETQKKIVSELKKHFDFSDNGQIPIIIDSALEQLKELQRITPNYYALIILMEKITNLEYPDRVNKFSELSEKEIQEISKAGNPYWKENKWVLPDGFIDKAKKITLNHPEFDQKSIYNDLIKEYYPDTDETPSFITVHRRLKEKGIW